MYLNCTTVVSSAQVCSVHLRHNLIFDHWCSSLNVYFCNDSTLYQHCCHAQTTNTDMHQISNGPVRVGWCTRCRVIQGSRSCAKRFSETFSRKVCVSKSGTTLRSSVCLCLSSGLFVIPNFFLGCFSSGIVHPALILCAASILCSILATLSGAWRKFFSKVSPRVFHPVELCPLNVSGKCWSVMIPNTLFTSASSSCCHDWPNAPMPLRGNFRVVVFGPVW